MTETLEKPAHTRTRRPSLVRPRFGTPRNPGRETYGALAAKVARWLHKPLMPWQQYSADIALEIDPATGELWYEEVVITVPRQSGKTTLILVILLVRCIIMARTLGSQTVTYLAQSGIMARRKLEREFARLMRAAKTLTEVPQESRHRPVVDTEWKLTMAHGSEHIAFGGGSYLQIEAPTGYGSVGDVLDVSVIDEARFRETDLVEQAVEAATVTRRSPQSYIVSTAGNERSFFFWPKVLAGRRACETRNHGRTCYLEWSVPDDEAFDDPKVWARYLPALGYTITVARLQARLAKALRNPDVVDEEGYEPGLAGFRNAYLNQWLKTPPVQSEVPRSEIDPEMWKALAVGVDSQIVGSVVIGVGVSLDGVSTSIVVAGRCADGVPRVETLERSSGVWWLERRLRELCEKWSPVAVGWDNGGPARTVTPEILRAASLGDPAATPVPLNGREWSAACEAFNNAVKEGRIRHLGDLFLADAVSGADRKEVGSGWVWNLRTARTDISPLVAATAALRVLETAPAPENTGELWFSLS